jgi:hypothetical protein
MADIGVGFSVKTVIASRSEVTGLFTLSKNLQMKDNRSDFTVNDRTQICSFLVAPAAGTHVARILYPIDNKRVKVLSRCLVAPSSQKEPIEGLG